MDGRPVHRKSQRHGQDAGMSEVTRWFCLGWKQTRLKLQGLIWDLRSVICDLWSLIWDLWSEICDLWSEIWDLWSEISDLWSEICDLRSEISEMFLIKWTVTERLVSSCSSRLLPARIMRFPTGGERPLSAPLLQHLTSGQLPIKLEGKEVFEYDDGRLF